MLMARSVSNSLICWSIARLTLLHEGVSFGAPQRPGLTYERCRSTNIDVQEILINIAKGQHRSPEYRAINPLGRLPGYAEPDFSLGESVAILKYLVATNEVPDHWYPAEARKRAFVDSACDWHHSNIRKGAATLVFHRIFLPRAGKPFDKKAATEAEGNLTSALKMLESFWLKSSAFVAGEEISIADLLMVTELDMLHMLAGSDQGMSRDEILRPFSKVTTWMKLVAETCHPHHEEVSKLLMKASARGEERLKAAKSKL